MKITILATILLSSLFLLTGCWTVYETPITTLKQNKKIDIKLKIENFNLETLQVKEINIGSSSGSSYNYKTDSYTQGHATHYSTTYSMQDSKNFMYKVVDTFENLGCNIRSDKPQLILSARIGHGYFDWTDPMLYIRDGMALLISIPTFMSIGSYERFNDVEIIVYNIKGNKLKTYKSTKNCYVFCLSVPFGNFANPKAYRQYGDEQSTLSAFNSCVNDFFKDLNNGYYDNE